MLVAELDDVTYDLEVDGVEVRRMVHRRVWERGAWATVAIVYEDRGSDGDWKPAKLALIRLQRVRGAWKKHAALTLHGTEAMQLCETLGTWRPALELAAATEPTRGGED